MRFQEAAMFLGLQHLHHLIERMEAKVHPRGGRERIEIRSVEDQIPDNLLSPGRPSLGIGGDDNVVIPKLEPIPSG
jgi:hypothetical protein